MRLSAAGSALAVALVLWVVAACGRGERPDAHARVACEGCHTGPAAGLAMSPAPPSACAACHATVDLSDTVALGDVRLSHAPHAELAPALALPCSGCHAHREGAQPLAVDPGTCFTCHGGTPRPVPVTTGVAAGTACATCHVEPSHKALTESRAPIDHAQIVERGISCTQCHYDVLRGGAGVRAVSCVNCHGQPPPALPTGLDDVEALHRRHLEGEGAVACVRCHDPPVHEIVGLTEAVALDCAGCHPAPHGALVTAGPEWSAACTSCHEDAHRSQQMLYTGLGVPGMPAQPAEMFIARVACRACHTADALAVPEGPNRIRALNESCMDCHGSPYEPMLPRWDAALDRRTADVAEYVAAANREARVRGRAGADSLVRGAADRLAVVLEGRGVHNVPFADAILRLSLRDAEAAYRAAGLSAPRGPRLGPNPAEVSCAHCHYGVEEAPPATVFGQRFGHAPHVLRADIACNECHSPADYFRAGERRLDPEHGKTTVTAAQCEACHHVRTRVPCASCHARERVAAIAVSWELVISVKDEPQPIRRTVEFRHADHPAVECATCHTSGRDIRTAAACTECHSDHHGARVTDCTSCHGDQAQVAHAVESHFACASCHGRSTVELLTPQRPFCLSCHTAQAKDHFPGQECAPCHMQLSPAEVKARILAR